MRTSKLSLALGAALALGSMSVAAHHGWGGNNQPIELTGTVVSPVDLSGPHATMQIRDADGQVWDITLAPAPRTARTGLEKAVPVGAEVTISGMRNDDPSRFEVKTRRVTHNGKNYDVYPQG
ncbi:MAG TPA: hypothetical protein VF339_08575 [Gammaproteobacteria bacterium]